MISTRVLSKVMSVTVGSKQIKLVINYTGCHFGSIIRVVIVQVIKRVVIIRVVVASSS